MAAADLRPLVVLFSDDAHELVRLRGFLEDLAWSDELVGRLRYVALRDEHDLEGFASTALEPGVSVVQAEAHGRGGEVLARAGTGASAVELRAVLPDGPRAFDGRAKDVREHLRDGARGGIEWEAAIPVTDPEARRRPDRSGR